MVVHSTVHGAVHVLRLRVPRVPGLDERGQRDASRQPAENE
jgi:hypothetical protein